VDLSEQTTSKPAATAPPRASAGGPKFRRAGVSDLPDEPPAAPPAGYRAAWMAGLSVLLLSLAFAPFGQFYLAWVGLVPWILFAARVRSNAAAFVWSWAAGWVFFLVNIWWLGFVTWPGTIAVTWYMGAYWGVAALLVRWVLGRRYEEGRWRMADGGKREAAGAVPPSSIVHPPSSPSLSSLSCVLLIAAIWTAGEWVRGWLFTGFPWSFLGHTQTPLLAMCQIADVAGVYGVTFWLVAVNAWIALFVRERLLLRPILPATLGVGALLLAVLGYGVFRLLETDAATSPGPTVMVVQCNFPQSNTGRKGASQEDFIRFHLTETRQALEQATASGRPPDLVAWSETVMPPIGARPRALVQGTTLSRMLEETHAAIADLARDFGVGLVTGGGYFDALHEASPGSFVPVGNRNSAYYYDPAGALSDLRHDKIHLVPFGEYIPFRQTIPWVYRMFLSFSPYDYDHTITPGDDDALTVFEVPAGSRAVRFVTPICFEDTDPALLARMFRPTAATGGAKRADLIVNLTNDGWFSQPQLSQHLQIARFRSIENRAPTARAVNTGVSAFVDSAGRVTKRLPTHVEGVATADVSLDRRLTVYTRWGDAFAKACAAATALLVAWALWRRRVEHRAVRLPL
jgi:apolipoprotein N-acyltransferase